MSVYEYKTKLNISHVNKENTLSYAGLTSILQEAASVHADCLGFGVNHVDKTHLTWLLLSWKIEIFATPKWNTEVIVKTWPREMAKVYSYRDFEVYDENSNLIAIASSKWVLINTLKHSIARITPEIIDRFNLENKCVFSDYTDLKLEEPEFSDLAFEYTTGRRDIDVNNHVNNLYYLDFALESLPKEFYENNFKNIEVLYKKEIKLGENIKCYYSNVDDKQIITIKSDDLSLVHAMVVLW